MLQAKEKKLPQILLAEDQKYALAAIEAFLQERHHEQYEIVGSVRDGSALVSEAMRLAPDVAVVDISMNGLSGVDATAELKRLNCTTKVVILTMYWEPELMRAAFAAGACGYVLKHRLARDLPSAIEAALRGEQFISPPLADSVA